MYPTPAGTLSAPASVAHRHPMSGFRAVPAPWGWRCQLSAGVARVPRSDALAGRSTMSGDGSIGEGHGTAAMHIDLGIALAGLIVGIVVGLTGMGGGALMTPVLVIIFGITPL